MTKAEVQTVITERLIAFHQGLVETGQIKPMPKVKAIYDDGTELYEDDAGAIVDRSRDIRDEP